MRQLGLAAVGAERPGRHVEFPVGPTLLAAGAGVPSLGYGHGWLFLSLGALAGGRILMGAHPRSRGFAAAGSGVPILAALRAEALAGLPAERQIGRASCRERV